MPRTALQCVARKDRHGVARSRWRRRDEDAAAEGDARQPWARHQGRAGQCQQPVRHRLSGFQRSAGGRDRLRRQFAAGDAEPDLGRNHLCTHADQLRLSGPRTVRRAADERGGVHLLPLRRLHARQPGQRRPRPDLKTTHGAWGVLCGRRRDQLRAAASMIGTNASAVRLAPPTRPPSTSGTANRLAAFLAAHEPP